MLALVYRINTYFTLNASVLQKNKNLFKLNQSFMHFIKMLSYIVRIIIQEKSKIFHQMKSDFKHSANAET